MYLIITEDQKIFQKEALEEIDFNMYSDESISIIIDITEMKEYHYGTWIPIDEIEVENKREQLEQCIICYRHFSGIKYICDRCLEISQVGGLQ